LAIIEESRAILLNDNQLTPERILLRGIRCLLESSIRCGQQSDPDDALSRFNRETQWFAIGLLGTLLLAALVFEVLLPEHYQPSQGLSYFTSQTWQTTPDFLSNVETTPALKAVKLDTKSFGSAVGKEASIPPDRDRTEISSNQDPVLMESSTNSTLSHEIDQTSGQKRNGSKWSLVRRQDSGAKREKIVHERHRSAHGFFGLKKQLVALWRSSLQRNEARAGRRGSTGFAEVLTLPTLPAMRTRSQLLQDSK
jgi:hypothetical protein